MEPIFSIHTFATIFLVAFGTTYTLVHVYQPLKTSELIFQLQLESFLQSTIQKEYFF